MNLNPRLNISATMKKAEMLSPKDHQNLSNHPRSLDMTEINY